MKRSLSILSGICFGIVVLVGCGGHEGGQLHIPADNPYQVSPSEEKARAQQRAAAFEARRAAEQAAAEAAAAEAEAAEVEEPKETPRTSPANAGRPNPTGSGRYAQ